MGLWGGREALTAIVMSEEVAMSIRKVLAAEETIHGPTLGREQRPEALLDGKDAPSRSNSTFLSATRDQISHLSGSICGRARAVMSWACPGEVTPRRRAARPGFRWVQITGESTGFHTDLGSRASELGSTGVSRELLRCSRCTRGHASSKATRHAPLSTNVSRTCSALRRRHRGGSSFRRLGSWTVRCRRLRWLACPRS